ncbi:MAG: M6 family metalloprotease domain-containing protein [Bacteroidales bacterium]|nr:M6 family metalloprotease domain-containing protein [Bacteroidales bacterium]
MKKKLLFVLATLLFATQQNFAVPAVPWPVDYELPDGTTVTIQLRGDERLNWRVTPDGYTLLFNSDGFLEYAVQDPIGDLKLSGIRMRNEAERTVQERSFLMNVPKNLRYSSSQVETLRQLHQIRDEEISKSMSEEDGIQRAFSGTIRVPMILVSFANREFTKTKAEIQALLTQLNYTTDGATGSVRDYFIANSYGQLNFEVDVFGPYTLPDNISSYATDCSGGNPGNMARLAVDSAYYRGGANFANYDYNNSGRVSTVHIIFAGYGTEAHAPGCNSIWSHASSIYPARNYNGKSISRYSCSPELRGNSGSNLTHIGVIAHELGHSLLGLPDFYDTDYDANGNAVDLGDWCLMASGSWNNSGRTPPYLSAYARIAAGWAQEVILSSPINITLPNPNPTDAATGTIYRINTTTNGEYYLLENRQETSVGWNNWDAYVPGSGMLIYHVDRTSNSVWNGNCINCSANRRRYYVKQAGCSATNGCASNRSTDPWPQSGSTEFTDFSIPNSKSWAGANTEKPVTNITHNTLARTVSFDFMGGTTDPDAALTEFVDLPNMLSSAMGAEFAPTDIKVRLKSEGIPLTSASIAWSVNGVAQTPKTWSGNLNTGVSEVVSLGDANLGIGINNIIAVVTTDGDINSANNTISKSVRVVSPFYVENFETTPLTGWTMINGTQTNKWHHGTATASSGTHSIYISNNGNDNAYTLSQTNRVHLYRDITFPASSDTFDLFFDLKVMGEIDGSTPYDYLEMRMVLTTVTPVAGSLLTSGILWGRYVNVGNNWQTVHVGLPSAYANTTQRLVFSWYNDNSSGAQPPAAIDNIAVATRTYHNNPTSIFDIEQHSTLNIYPNPVTNGVFYVETGGESDLIEIYDFTGKRVYTAQPPFTLHPSPFTIDISHLPDGTYIVRIGETSAKIVKRK